jgi:hypothetical protein
MIPQMLNEQLRDSSGAATPPDTALYEIEHVGSVFASRGLEASEDAFGLAPLDSDNELTVDQLDGPLHLLGGMDWYTFDGIVSGEIAQTIAKFTCQH